MSEEEQRLYHFYLQCDDGGCFELPPSKPEIGDN